MVFESTQYFYAVIPKDKQIKLKEICLQYKDKNTRYEEIRKYCNQFLFDYVIRGLNPRLLTQYLENLYL